MSMVGSQLGMKESVSLAVSELGSCWGCMARSQGKDAAPPGME